MSAIMQQSSHKRAQDHPATEGAVTFHYQMIPSAFRRNIVTLCLFLCTSSVHCMRIVSPTQYSECECFLGFTLAALNLTEMAIERM